jgi:hypothetical protein
MGWVESGGSNLAPGPLGSVAGEPDRHRGWLLCLCPSSVPAAAGRGLRPLPLPLLRVLGSWAIWACWLLGNEPISNLSPFGLAALATGCRLPVAG